jgi:hypothetical protein
MSSMLMCWHCSHSSHASSCQQCSGSCSACSYSSGTRVFQASYGLKVVSPRFKLMAQADTCYQPGPQARSTWRLTPYIGCRVWFGDVSSSHRGEAVTRNDDTLSGLLYPHWARPRARMSCCVHADGGGHLLGGAQVLRELINATGAGWGITPAAEKERAAPVWVRAALTTSKHRKGRRPLMPLLHPELPRHADVSSGLHLTAMLRASSPANALPCPRSRSGTKKGTFQGTSPVMSPGTFRRSGVAHARP